MLKLMQFCAWVKISGVAVSQTLISRGHMQILYDSLNHIVILPIDLCTAGDKNISIYIYCTCPLSFKSICNKEHKGVTCYMTSLSNFSQGTSTEPLVIPRRSRRDIVLASSILPFLLSTLFVRPEPYLSTYWSDLTHSWYE